MLKGRFHPTKETLIRTVLELLDSQSVDEVNSDDVLEKSGISKGSMYHHFEDFTDLLEHAQVARFASYVDKSIDMLSSLLVIRDREEFANGIRQVTKFTQSISLKPERLYRATALSRAGVSDRMKANLSAEQSRLSAALADLYREVINRGWGNPQVKPETVAVFIQAYTLGMIVDDYVEEPMDHENWLFLIDLVLNRVLFTGE